MLAVGELALWANVSQACCPRPTDLWPHRGETEMADLKPRSYKKEVPTPRIRCHVCRQIRICVVENSGDARGVSYRYWNKWWNRTTNTSWWWWEAWFKKETFRIHTQKLQDDVSGLIHSGGGLVSKMYLFWRVKVSDKFELSLIFMWSYRWR